MGILDLFKKKKEPKLQLPPVPDWQPPIKQPIDRVVQTMSYYGDCKNDFAVFKHGTVAIIQGSLPDEELVAVAKESLNRVFHSHPDMHPQEMDDGNILIGYQRDVATVVFSDIVSANWETIDQNHQRALATSEVLITPLGQNVFNDFGKKALFGRTYMFMDAQEPEVVEIFRKSI